LSLSVAYKFSVCGFVRFAYGTAAGTADQSADRNRPKTGEIKKRQS
jgi:hypothetical protein